MMKTESPLSLRLYAWATIVDWLCYLYFHIVLLHSGRNAHIFVRSRLEVDWKVDHV